MSDNKKVLSSKRAPSGAVTQKYIIMKRLEDIKNEVRDESGIENPNLWLWEQKHGVYYPVQQVEENDCFIEIVINYHNDSENFNQICFTEKDYTLQVEPFSLKYHSKYLNLDITRFEQIKN